MGFIDTYLSKYRLDQLSGKTLSNLKILEKKIAKAIDENETSATFDECTKKFGPDLADIVERFSAHFSKVSFSISSIAGSLKFVISIGTEVHQLVEKMQDCLITNDMTEEAKKAAKISFGQNLVYFVWMTVDPLKGKLGWLPFKSTIEKKVVFWLSGMALEYTVDLFAAQAVKPMSADSAIQMRAFPG